MNRLNNLLTAIRPITNAVALAKLAGIPPRAISKHYSWIDGNETGMQCPIHHGPAIVAALCKMHGGCYPVDGHIIYHLPEDDIFVTILPNGKQKKLKDETGAYNQYNEPPVRCLYSRDEFATEFMGTEK